MTTAFASRPSATTWRNDVLLALGLSALSLVVVQAGAQDIGSLEPVSIALLLLQTLPLAFRHVAPWPVFAVSAGATVAHAALATESLNTSLGSLFALYSVADQSDRRRSAVAAVVLGVALGAILMVKAPMPAALGALLQAELAVLVAWTLGTWSRERSRPRDRLVGALHRLDRYDRLVLDHDGLSDVESGNDIRHAIPER